MTMEENGDKGDNNVAANVHEEEDEDEERYACSCQRGNVVKVQTTQQATEEGVPPSLVHFCC